MRPNLLLFQYNGVFGHALIMKKYIKWIVLALILAFTIGIEAYKGEGKLPWAFIFAGVVIFFVYSFWRQK